MNTNQQFLDNQIGVEQELRRFALNEYLGIQNGLNVNVVGSGDIPADEQIQNDDLLTTNPILNEPENETNFPILEKTRYLKKTVAYININSAARNQKPIDYYIENIHGMSNGFVGGSLFGSDGIYSHSNNYAPYIHEKNKVNITASNNQMSFSIRDYRELHDPKQLISADSKSSWNIFINYRHYDANDLGSTIQKIANQVVYKETGIKDLFKITSYVDPILNTDRVTVTIEAKKDYKFIWTFHDDSQSTNQYSSMYHGMLELMDSYAPQSAKASKHLGNYQKTEYYPNPNYYKLYLDQTYHNVDSISVIASQIPHSDTIINVQNNHITFAIRDKTKQVPNNQNPHSQNILNKNKDIYWHLYIQPGNYTVIELAAEMELAMNNMVFGEAKIANMFSITTNVIKNIFEISVNSPYSFLFDFNGNESLGNRNLYRMLGFSSPVGQHPGQYVTHLNNLITLNIANHGRPKYIQIPYGCFNLIKSRTIWLKINHFNAIYDTLTKDHYFAKLTIDSNQVNQFNPTTFMFDHDSKNQLDTLEISFFDENGQPYNFNNMDHTFTLQINYQLDKLVNNHLETRIGRNENGHLVVNHDN